MLLRVVLFFFVVIVACNPSSAQIYINEWMASNSSVISDPDFDNTGDWIEIFNDFNEEVDLSGYFLTDNFNNPTKWVFPQGTTIGANSILLVWADGENTGIHTNFKLTREAEEIGLYGLDTVSIDELSYANHKTNISQGRQTDGSSTISYFLNPTPGENNNTQAYDGITFYEPHFDVTGGIYESTVQVEMSTIDGTIKYTTDGSEPNENSATYTGPITIDETTIIRARTLIENHIPGKIKTNTYFISEDKNIQNLPVVSISGNPDYFWDPEIGLYVQDFKPSWEYPINVELFENDGSDRAAFNELAGTKVNGLNSWVLPQKMLGIYFDNDYDQNNLEYQLFFNKDRKRYDNFVLRASGSDWGNTLFRDALCQDLTDGYMNVEHMDYRPAVAFINGEYMGIHNLRSRIDEGYIEDNFGLLGSEYDLIENNGKIEQGDTVSFNEMFDLFENDLSDPVHYQEVDEVVDIENFTDYIIAQIWSSNSSWGHNIQMWKPKASGTKWRWIMQDFDRGFVGEDDNFIDSYSTATSPSNYIWAREPLNALLENDAYAANFASKITSHLYTTFHPIRVIDNINKYADLIAPNIQNHVDRWAGKTSSYGNGLTSMDYWEGEVEELRTFATARRTNLMENIQSAFSLSDPVTLSLSNQSTSDGQITINGLKIPDNLWTGPYFQNMTFELEAIPAPGEEFLGWSSTVFRTLIESPEEWKFHDQGIDLGTSWTAIDYDDASWGEGFSELGYGDDDETTIVSFGGDSEDKHITTYFRKSIEIEDIAVDAGSLIIELLADDGAVVYVNGVEVLRNNMPTGPINNQTIASDFIADPVESTFYPYIVPSAALIQGNNVIAVEVHQSSGTTSDMSFDMKLHWMTSISGQYISTDPKITVNLSSDTSLVANYISTSACVLRGVISENTTLTKDCSPYLVASNIIVTQDAILTIEPGVEINFQEDTDLTIHGNLQAIGTESEPISFLGIDGNGWGSIILNEASSIARMTWVEIAGASQGSHPIYENAALSIFESAIEIDHMTIVDVSNNPILAYYSDVTLRNSELHSKVTGDLINVKYGSAIVENCSFSGNEKIDTDAIDYDDVTDGIIRGNKITGFLGFNSDGIDIGEESKNVLIENNFIHNCTDKGISAGQLSTMTIRNNTIVNCDIGVAIKDQSTADIDQNTFYNVTSPISAFEKNIGLGGGIAFLTNSILSNSTGHPVEFDIHSFVESSYNLSDTDTLQGVSNIVGHPRFETPSYYDFNLQNNSDAIGTGIDNSGMSINLGSKNISYTAQPSLMISSIQYAPSGHLDAEFIDIYNPLDISINLEDYFISEAIDFIFPDYEMEAGETIRIALNSTLIESDGYTTFQWTRGRLSNEGETIRLTSKYGIVLDQVIYDNKTPWPEAADGNGSYLSLMSPELDNHHAESWETLLPTSTEDYEDIDISIFPNPVSSILNVKSNEPFQRISICNTFGVSVLNITTSNATEEDIDISSINSGTYFVKIDERWIKKVVVIR